MNSLLHQWRTSRTQQPSDVDFFTVIIRGRSRILSMSGVFKPRYLGILICSVSQSNTTWSTTASWSRTPDAPSFAPLRSAHANVLTVPRTNTRLCDRSFSVAGPRIWNSLPASLRQPYIDFGHFKRLFKGISVWRDRGTLVTLWFQCAVYKSIYLFLLTYNMTQLSSYKLTMLQSNGESTVASTCNMLTKLHICE